MSALEQNPSGEPLVTVVGGGFAGCEAAWQLAEAGLSVVLVEMKPVAMSPAHQSPLLCEVVCSNSFKSDDPATPAGLLKAELRRLDSLVLACAEQHRVPAGVALAVDRDEFAREVTARLSEHPRVRIERRVADRLPDGPAIIATGPLTGGELAHEIAALCGGERLHFYDAIAPIVSAESIDPEQSFRGSRWGRDSATGDGDADGDYINCPVDEPTYYELVRAVREGRKIEPRPFEEPRYFEGCLPIEVMAERGDDVLRHGPMRPVGLDDPRTGRWPFALVQLRPENRYLSAYNLVGFQTRLAYPEQKRIFRIIPALRRAEFLRYGSIHRNTYLDAPALLGPEFELSARTELRFAGLLLGVEGYLESCAMGLLAALFLAGRLRGRPAPPPPVETALGGLYQHVTAPRERGQTYAPTNINFGLLPRLDVRAKKRERKRLVAERAVSALGPWLEAVRRSWR